MSEPDSPLPFEPDEYHESLMKQRDTLRSTLTQQEQEIAQLKAEVERLTREREYAEAMVKDCAKAIQRLTASRDEWKAKYEELTRPHQGEDKPKEDK